MDILHGWNAHFQDDILTVREDDGISILRWMFVSLIFNSVEVNQIMFIIKSTCYLEAVQKMSR